MLHGPKIRRKQPLDGRNIPDLKSSASVIDNQPHNIFQHRTDLINDTLKRLQDIKFVLLPNGVLAFPVIIPISVKPTRVGKLLSLSLRIIPPALPLTQLDRPESIPGFDQMDSRSDEIWNPKKKQMGLQDKLSRILQPRLIERRALIRKIDTTIDVQRPINIRWRSVNLHADHYISVNVSNENQLPLHVLDVRMLESETSLLIPDIDEDLSSAYSHNVLSDSDTINGIKIASVPFSDHFFCRIEKVFIPLLSFLSFSLFFFIFY